MSYRPRIGGGGKREWRPTLPKPRKKPLASPFCHQRARLSFQRLSETCRQESNTFKNPNESGGEGGIRTRGKRQKKGLFLRISKILCAMRCKENRSCAWEIVGKQSPRINPVAMNLRILLPILITWGCLAQPSTNSATLATFDVNHDGRLEGTFVLEALHQGDLPEIWEVFLGLVPNGQSRILKASNDRIDFTPGEQISPTSAIYFKTLPNPPQPPIYNYNLGFLSYIAILNPDWVYYTLSAATFETVSEFILGYRFALSDGDHAGWIKFQRPTVDQYTPFALAGFDFHPVPNEAIVAGEPAPMPSIEARASAGVLALSWDARWGPLGLECSSSLAGGEWKALDGTFVGGTTIGLQEEKMFARLRRP